MLPVLACDMARLFRTKRYENAYTISLLMTASGPEQKSRGPRAMSALQVIAAEIFEKTEVADSISAYPP